VEQVSRAIIRDHYVALLELQKQHEKFAETWDNNVRLQGYEELSRISAFSAKQDLSGGREPAASSFSGALIRAAGRNPLGFSLHPFPAASGPARRLRGRSHAPRAHRLIILRYNLGMAEW
jgi:hypothetical protein